MRRHWMTFMACVVAVAATAAWLSAEPVPGDAVPEPTFAGETLMVQTRTGLTEVLQNPRIRQAGGRSFVVGENPDFRTNVWVAMSDVTLMREFRTLVEYENFQKMLKAKKAKPD